jgi:predicted O-linked N-acetylglucosamine transferase (SPINDLY family)
VTCYANGSEEDATTERLKALSDAWRIVAAKSDDEAHALIRDDRIDILVDLAGHTGRNRMTLFARRAAPIQVTYLGYPNTTGLKAMDYRFTDAMADPVGSTEALHTETLVRLDGGFLCYRPPEDGPAVAEPPVVASGCITFGSFNTLAKVNVALIARWSAILAGVPDSRLVLKARSFADPVARDYILQLFVQNGIAPERIELSDWTADTRSHLERYAGIDIALDTFPYNGTATTCEALWMGVPVVTMAGRVHASRVGASLLSRIGLDALIASSPEAYLRAAIDLAHDLPRLRDLRGALRARMAASPLMDSARIARAVEAAYRTMWRQYCLKP